MSDINTDQRAVIDFTHSFRQKSDHPPDCLIHYTSAPTFYAIMKSGLIRMSSVRSMNDTSEWTYGCDVLKKALQSTPSEWPAEMKTLWQNYPHNMHQHESRSAIYCFSLSAATGSEIEEGSLSQWRLYGDHGKGIALTVERISSSFSSFFSKAPLKRVIYGEEAGIKAIHDVAERFMEGILKMPEAQNPAVIAYGWRHYLYFALNWLPAIIKHEAYAHENEYRMVSFSPLPDQQVKFFERNGIQIPFIEHSIWDPENGENTYRYTIFRKAICGPNSEKITLEDSIRQYLSSIRVTLGVKISNLPYRGY